MKACWRRPRDFNRGPACDGFLDVAQQPIAIAESKGLPVFRTPKHSTNSFRIAATTICLGLRRPRDFNRVTSEASPQTAEACILAFHSGGFGSLIRRIPYDG